MGNIHNIPLLFLSLGIPEWFVSTSSSLVDGNMVFKKKEDPAERMCFNLYSSHSNLLSSIVLCVTLTEVSRYLYYQLVIVRNKGKATICTRTVATKWSSGQKTLSPAKSTWCTVKSLSGLIFSRVERKANWECTNIYTIIYFFQRDRQKEIYEKDMGIWKM